jgi:hypothetical protein
MMVHPSDAASAPLYRSLKTVPITNQKDERLTHSVLEVCRSFSNVRVSAIQTPFDNTLNHYCI